VSGARSRPRHAPPRHPRGGAPPPGRDARIAAWRIIRRVTRDGAWTGPVVDDVLGGSGLDARDRALASNLAFQTLRWRGTLDWALGHVVSRPLDEVEPGLLDVLRLGAWQLLHGRMPDRAAVSATVEVAAAQLGRRTVGFANGVLRGLARRRDALLWPPADTVDGRALRLGYPPWIVAAADDRFGAGADAELDAGNVPAGLVVRGDAGVRDALADAGAQVTPGTLAAGALHVEGLTPGALLDRVPGAVIQDEASMVVGDVVAAALRGDGPVLDACAAPGGKTTHLATTGRTVVAADRSADRLALVGQLAGRLGTPLPLVVADGARPPWRPAAFAGVLVDAPCTGLGVVRRRPELRWRRDADDVAALAELQRRILAGTAGAVAPGGALVYSVCTWTRAETVDVVAGFLAHDDRFEPEAPAVDVAAADASADDGTGLQLRTAVHGCDGMYVAVLRRRA
jgi:16S rRNA (cytosine967-C5)-methyltransferase